jgi:hypothetical protein
MSEHAPPQPDVLGLPTEGAMGTEPAMSVSTIMAIIGGAVAVGSQLFGYDLPPEVRVFANDWGPALAGAAVAAWALIQGRLIRNRVVSPATTLALVQRALGTMTVPASALSSIRLHHWR